MFVSRPLNIFKYYTGCPVIRHYVNCFVLNASCHTECCALFISFTTVEDYKILIRWHFKCRTEQIMIFIHPMQKPFASYISYFPMYKLYFEYFYNNNCAFILLWIFEYNIYCIILYRAWWTTILFAYIIQF